MSFLPAVLLGWIFSGLTMWNYDLRRSGGLPGSDSRPFSVCGLCPSTSDSPSPLTLPVNETSLLMPSQVRAEDGHRPGLGTILLSSCLPNCLQWWGGLANSPHPCARPSWATVSSGSPILHSRGAPTPSSWALRERDPHLQGSALPPALPSSA